MGCGETVVWSRSVRCNRCSSAPLASSRSAAATSNVDLCTVVGLTGASRSPNPVDPAAPARRSSLAGALLDGAWR
jgi:hypothetical protein